MSTPTSQTAITGTQTLQPGADIWILQRPEESSWTRQVDWYLNFQISRGLKVNPKQRSENLNEMLRQIDWELPEKFLEKDRSLLIASGRGLPTPWVFLPETWDADGRFLHLVTGLRPRKVRIFPGSEWAPRPSTPFPFELEIVRENP